MKIIKKLFSMVQDRLSSVDYKKFILLNLPYMFVWFLVDRAACLYRLSPGNDFGSKILAAMGQSYLILASPIPSFYGRDVLIALVAAVCVKVIVLVKKADAKKLMKGKEYGSARWGTAEDIKPFMDKEPDQNIILTRTEGLTMCSRPKIPQNARNKNVIAIGGSGSGKTRNFCKPNLMQLHSSYVVTDPKGTVVLETGKMFKHAGYRIKIFNTINFNKSLHYNPFHYIHAEKDILKLVNALILNTKGEGAQSTEDFWVKAERLLYCALIGLIWYEGHEDEKNINTLIDLINASETREEDETFKNAVDMLFDELESENPEHFAVRQYKKYKLAAGKTAKSILISCGARLAPFDIAELREICAYDELELDQLGERKSVFFLIMSDTDSTFSFLIALIYTQLFNSLCEKADDEHGGRLPVHVRCILDEFANCGQIPNFERLIATIRSREISCSIILQTQSQLKAIYKDHCDTIIGNCDTMLFLGGKEETTLKSLENMLGTQSIDVCNTSETKSSQQSHGVNYQKTGRKLMTQDELAVMNGCILQIRGVRPFFSEKYDITKHKRYRQLSDFDKKNNFDIEKELNTKLRLTPNMEVQVVEIEVPEVMQM